jgi:hypothetical protein
MQKTFICIALGVVILGFTEGCGSVYKVSPIISYDKSAAEPWEDTGWLRKHTVDYVWKFGERETLINYYTFNPSYIPTNTSPKKLDAELRANSLYFKAHLENNTNAENARLARNELQNAIMNVSDGVVSLHLARLKATENNGNMLFGGSAITASSLAAVTTGGTAAAWATAATGSAAARELFSDQVYRNALVETLIAAIEADRDKTRQDILASQSKSVSEYDVEKALEDACTYHLHGSFYYGLTLIRAAAEEKNQQKLSDTASQKKLSNLPSVVQAESQVLDLLNGKSAQTLTNAANALSLCTNSSDAYQVYIKYKAQP